MSTFTPTPVQQKQYTQPSDGGNKDAASVDVMLQALADGAAAGPLIPFNWHTPVSTGANGMNRGWFSVKEQAWYAVGDNAVDALDVSYSDGRTWKSLTGGLGTSLTLIDVAFDTNGNGVLLANNADVYVGTFTAWGNVTWVAHAAVIPSSPSAGRLTFDAVHGKWITVYRNGSSGMVIATTNTPGAAWTSQALPLSWTNYSGTAATPVVFYSGAGTLIATFIDLVATPNKLRVIRSTDGGTTWTDVADISPATGTPTSIALAYDPVYEVWFLSASTNAATEIYSSINDGVTWTAVSSMPGTGYPEFTLLEIVSLCGVLVGLNTDGRIFFSPDLSGTWFFATAHKGTSGSPTGMRLGDGRIVVWNRADATAHISLRHGGVGLEVV